MRIAEFRVYSSIVSPCLLPVLKGGHQSRGQDSREDRDERIVVGRAGGEDRQGQVEAGDEDSGLQWRHPAPDAAAAVHSSQFCLLSLISPPPPWRRQYQYSFIDSRDIYLSSSPISHISPLSPLRKENIVY